ncbi:hypothetical protein [Nocardia donostiensis]|uniref:Uncharacterized protein n=1 Tax=Nocardia donostiensis TaxID=1538463 RepID=A0A1V2TIA1_9NOCA|nr:hypothetical protein [Nocardia donostiensis]ONM49257.1 hypothetical protein B0T46_07640 [Nocardia donostiensis]OQS21781.1 hypothetical protein B0T44_06595 [Nocardia donostiensis]
MFENSEATAREQLHRYLVETLRALPARLSLSQVDPAMPEAVFSPGTTLPCNDNDDEAGPRYFDIGYWLIGTTAATSDVDIDLVAAAWTRLGWRTHTPHRGRPRAVFCRTPDQYGLTVQQSVDGHLSLFGSTPPFPSDATGGEPLPRTIEHP